MRVLALCGILALSAWWTGVAHAQATVTRAVQVAGQARTYRLHVPANPPEGKALPLVLMFHGGGGTAKWAERESRFSDLADREGFLVAYPQGYRKSWNDGRDDSSIAAQRDDVDDLAFVAAILDDIAVEHRLDAGRVYATGISNGATFSHYLGASMSTRIAAIAPVAGGMAEPLGESFHPERPVSVLMINGTDDPLVHYEGGKITLPGGGMRGAIIGTESAARKWAERNGCRREPVATDLPDKNPGDGTRARRLAYPGCMQGIAVELYRIEGGGHTWPGGIQYLPKRVIGNLSRDIDATKIIWDFFSRHARP